MRYLGLSALMASSLFVLPPVSVAGAPAWEPAAATSVTAGATHSTFIVQASVTLPKSCYAARIRSTPITLHTARSFYVEQLGPASPCTGASSNYTCTVVSPDFPLPIPHTIEVVSKGEKQKVMVATNEPRPTPPLCRKS
jgi:hypothetical protein